MKEHAIGERPPYVDPLSDIGFIQLFGSERGKEILMDFLNALLTGCEAVCDLEYQPIKDAEDQARAGEILLDLRCTDEKGKPFYVHLQRSRQGIAYESLLYHSVRLLSGQQAPEAPDTGFMARIYIVGLMSFIVPVYEEYGCIMERDMVVTIGSAVKNVTYDVNLVLKAIEVPRFARRENELQTDLDKWLFLLKNLGGMKKIPASLKNTSFEKVFHAAAS